jgi:hypothetical protein
MVTQAAGWYQNSGPRLWQRARALGDAAGREARSRYRCVFLSLYSVVMVRGCKACVLIVCVWCVAQMVATMPWLALVMTVRV